MIVDLNSDLGEGAENDHELMRLVTSANVCCGMHAGDEATSRLALELAKEAGVVVGAHPGYADREHFGRREIDMNDAELFQAILTQVESLIGWAASIGVSVCYVKPHGALYNQACREERIARVVLAAANHFDLPVLALPGSKLETLSGRQRFVREGFADRRYRADGSLVPRTQANAFVTDPVEAAQQAMRLVREHGVRSLCVHGDHPEAVAFVRELRRAFVDAGFQLKSFADD